ncbi:pyridoxal phosphate-dependent transferase [Pseudomassariella vexata]|uniref:Pyridoxal phosphate-dependent transferase n=1 Tax=Pseudomassariella vexata TaxID=1141098 RepID=A0A1Y2EC21_9PEZI|nr:pyridoxal phosphate-dependent transferase [Pseudomassariella vexata]ORY69120.1 pyridoxal phosphate-dependent transferase [Pseudomassariella vexata]
MTSFASPLWRKLQVYQVYGANTNVGKTVITTLLCKVAPRAGFLKPVSTGPSSEADDRHVKQFSPGTVTQCLYQFEEPVSPHIAATAHASQAPGDAEIVSSIHNILTRWAKDEAMSHAFVETAGGVHSPGPSGTSQADLYRPLRLPVVLVADFRLGGISSTIAAYESLLVRGYDVESVLVFEDAYYRNSDYLMDYFAARDIPLLALQRPPERLRRESLGNSSSDDAFQRDQQAMARYYEAVSRPSSGLGGLLSDLSVRHERRIGELETMASTAHKSIWYPFTQHNGLKPESLTVIDSARGDHFQVFQQPAVKADSSSSSVLGPVYDGSASWWTQGLGHGNPELALGAAYAAGRYGHVMFALGAHKPAIELAGLVLQHTANERLVRVFYSDNGSTAMEVAVKMALRASCQRYRWNAGTDEVEILGLKGSYHGDTIGTMDCSEPSTFNQKVEWYRGRGYWFDFPQVKMVRGSWTVVFPDQLAHAAHGNERESFSSLADIFNIEHREHSGFGRLYAYFIQQTLENLVKKQGRKFGALILEPLVLGAGGMLFVDPLFQHMLIKTVRQNPELIEPSLPIPGPSSSKSWTGLPIIFDEVFTGLYRFYHFSPSTFFPQASRPDIVANAKLLTGGLLPLSMTLASEDIFDAFSSSPAKEQALLHGHSYTAHPVGCHVARMSVTKMMEMERDGAWDQFKESWVDAGPGVATVDAAPRVTVWSIWPQNLLTALSNAASVESVWALGTVLSIVLCDHDSPGEPNFLPACPDSSFLSSRG